MEFSEEIDKLFVHYLTMKEVWYLWTNRPKHLMKKNEGIEISNYGEVLVPQNLQNDMDSG